MILESRALRIFHSDVIRQFAYHFRIENKRATIRDARIAETSAIKVTRNKMYVDTYVQRLINN